MNFRIKRVRIERVRIAPARPILSKRFWIAAILFQGWAFLHGEVFRTESLSCMLPCVKYNHASDTAQGHCCQEYAGALHGRGGRRLSWVRWFSVSSMSMLQLLRFVLCHDEFPKSLTLLRRGTRFGAAPRGDGASETQYLSSFRDVEQLFPDWEDEQNLRHFRVSYEEGGLRLGCISTVRPQFKRARLENVVWPWFSRSEKILWNQRDSNSVWPGPYWTYRAELTNDPSLGVNQKLNDSEAACCGAEAFGLRLGNTGCATGKQWLRHLHSNFALPKP